MNTPGVDARLRDVVLSGRLAGAALDPDGDEVLAVADSGPAWTALGGPGARAPRARRAGRARRPTSPSTRCSRARALAAVALIHFLRAVSAPAGWRPPPLRATMHFDDPNLRWRSYGFINYGELLEHADAHGYHVAMATIPLDAGRPSRAAAALFRERPDRLSLVFHGNDHVKGELHGAQGRRRRHRGGGAGAAPDRALRAPRRACASTAS